MLRTTSWCVAAVLAACLAATANAATVAVTIPAGTLGNDGYEDTFGIRFNVIDPAGIDVTQIGAFDDDDGVEDSIAGTLTAYIHRIDVPGLVASQTFTAADPGTLNGQFRFKDIAPVNLPPGLYMISAGGFNGTDQWIYGPSAGSTPSTLNTNGGRIDFPNGNSWYDGVPPGTNENLAPTQYVAGSFVFTEAVPEPSSFALAGIAGLVGMMVFRRRK